MKYVEVGFILIAVSVTGFRMMIMIGSIAWQDARWLEAEKQTEYDPEWFWHLQHTPKPWYVKVDQWLINHRM